MYNISMENNFDTQNKSNPFNSSGASDIDFGLEGGTWSSITSPRMTEHRLNDYDNNLFSEGAYKKVDDEMFQLEYRISRIEAKLSAVNSQISSATAMKDFSQLGLLEIKKNQFERELISLKEQYNSKSLPAKLSGEILSLVTDAPKKSAGLVKKVIDYLNINLFAKIPGRFGEKLHIKDALLKLESINKNVDNLVSMQTPYGEAPEKYEQLLQYLNTANSIQYQISQMVNKR